MVTKEECAYHENVFISFSSKETAEAIHVCELLEQNHISCFISTRDLVPGREYAEQLVQNIDEVKAVVLLLSNNSNNSPHVLREIEYAVSHKVPILVHALEEVSLSKSMEYYLMTHQWITNTADRDQKLVEGIRQIISKNNALPSQD
ncbi:MAG: toll/interleukin-1 receptor domain-containing protein [Lachnospiraceae bacterium]|nr:toll/interleukin-1 receptor domain-containing protein [Lachnospiraceae bacterium]